MLILTIRTDKPDAEIGLYDGQVQLAQEIWTAHRQLAETVHMKIEAVLEAHKKRWQDVQAVACFQGPGSFTGLRIGLTVANAIAYSYGVPVVAARGDDWLALAIARLRSGEYDGQVIPHYGADAHITPPKK